MLPLHNWAWHTHADARRNARSMAVGEYISVSSQRDSEQADIEKERVEQAKGAHPM